MLKKILIAALLFILYHQNTFAQDNTVSFNFSHSSFADVITDMEQKCSYHFYYDPPVFSSDSITISLTNISAGSFLDTLSRLAGFTYSIDNMGRVYLLKGRPITTSIPASFFVTGDDDNAAGLPKYFDEDTAANKTVAKSGNKKSLIIIGGASGTGNKNTAEISGFVKEGKSGSAVAGAIITADSTKGTAIADQFGYYILRLPKGKYFLRITSVGMEEENISVMVNGDGRLNIDMREYVPSLKTVIVKSDRQSNVNSVLAGVEKINIKTIRKVPTLLGETDVIKVLLTLPGVTSTGEASAGFNVRGGTTDQNLILFDDATIYNPTHLFGFFSAFNADIVKNVDFYKSAIPEKYGGRLSSVLDVSTREGNKKKMNLTGGIGPLTSKLTFEAPIAKDKSSFYISGRTTYSDWILRAIKNSAYNKSTASFYDLVMHSDLYIDSKNSVYITGYASNDQFRLNSDTIFKYGNKNIVAKWKHVFSNKMYSLFTTGFDYYGYAVSSDANPVNAFKLSYSVNQAHAGYDMNFIPDNDHTINAGISAIYYNLSPGSYNPAGSSSIVTPDALQKENSLETAVYIGDRYTVNSKLSVNAGLRFSMFSSIGPRQVYNYAPGIPKSVNSIIDTAYYGNGKIINTYGGPEVRMSLRYLLGKDLSLKLSYNTLRQYIHLLSNTTIISPTDTWKLCDPNIKPQTGSQVSAGLYKDFKSGMFETSVEVYYKHINNILDYKSGATLLMNSHIETDVLASEGKAYGAELLIKKKTGKLNGWLSYSYSRTWLRTSDMNAGELINRGEFYPANADRPNNLNFICNYSFSHRFSISGTFIYTTGRPVTLPIAIYYTGGSQRIVYSDRNAYRIPDYIRADISVNIDAGHNLKKLAHSSWSFGAYNLLGRKNPYSVYFTQEAGKIKGYQISIFGSIIPFVTYNFKL